MQSLFINNFTNYSKKFSKKKIPNLKGEVLGKFILSLSNYFSASLYAATASSFAVSSLKTFLLLLY